MAEEDLDDPQKLIMVVDTLNYALDELFDLYNRQLGTLLDLFGTIKTSGLTRTDDYMKESKTLQIFNDECNSLARRFNIMSMFGLAYLLESTMKKSDDETRTEPSSASEPSTSIQDIPIPNTYEEAVRCLENLVLKSVAWKPDTAGPSATKPEETPAPPPPVARPLKKARRYKKRVEM